MRGTVTDKVNKSHVPAILQAPLKSDAHYKCHSVFSSGEQIGFGNILQLDIHSELRTDFQVTRLGYVVYHICSIQFVTIELHFGHVI